jgi:isopentenyl diphosphate isomerase/L-lactate dehydrogenase-like FMN-dependent dehydrogenase
VHTEPGELHDARGAVLRLGQQGVEIALEILKTELIRDMQLAGATSIEKITNDYVTMG